MDKSGKTLPEPSLGLSAPEKVVLLEQIRVLYQTQAVVFVNLLNASLTAYVLRDLLPVRMFAGWIGLFCIVVLARFLDCRRYLRAPQQAESAEGWGWRYAAGATATGCLWGLTAAGILITPDPAYHAFIAFVVGGMMAGAVAGDFGLFAGADRILGPSLPAGDLRLFCPRRSDVDHHGIDDYGLHCRSRVGWLSRQSLDRFHCPPRDHSEEFGRRSRPPNCRTASSRARTAPKQWNFAGRCRERDRNSALARRRPLDPKSAGIDRPVDGRAQCPLIREQ